MPLKNLKKSRFPSSGRYSWPLYTIMSVVYTHYDDYRPPITGHFRDYRLFADFLTATSRLLKMINGHLVTIGLKFHAVSYKSILSVQSK